MLILWTRKLAAHIPYIISLALTSFAWCLAQVGESFLYLGYMIEGYDPIKEEGKDE
jgi:hypothetical protein